MNVSMTNKALIVFFLILTSLLTACGDTSALQNSGVAGQSTSTESISPAAIEPIDAPPSPTPFPEAFGRIVFVSNREGQNDLFITSADGSQVTKLTNNIAENTTPRISPDGTRVAFVSTANGNTDIFVLDLISGALTRVTTAPEKDSAPTWSPDGRQLAFESFRDGNFEIYVTNSDGSNQYRLTNDPAADTQPIWSPTSNEIAFVSNRFGNADILIANTAGTIFTLTTNPKADNNLTWSPDGSILAYQAFIDENYSNLCLIGKDGLNGRCLTSDPAKYFAPVFSPVGSLLAVIEEGVGIQIFNLADNSVAQISAPNIHPLGKSAFSPDGLRVVFQAQFNGDIEIFSALIPTSEFFQITLFTGYDGEAIWIEN